MDELHASQHFDCISYTRLCIFPQTENYVHISALPNIEYAVMSHPFSKWDKVSLKSITFMKVKSAVNIVFHSYTKK